MQKRGCVQILFSVYLLCCITQRSDLPEISASPDIHSITSHSASLIRARLVCPPTKRGVHLSVGQRL